MKLALCAAVAVGSASLASGHPPASQDGKLHISVSSAQQSVPVWGVVSVAMKFENRSQRDVTFSNELLFGPYQGAQLVVVVEGPGLDGPVYVVPESRRILWEGAGSPRQLRSGEAAELRATVYGYETRTVWPEPSSAVVPFFREKGDYKVSVVYTSPEGEPVASNVVKVAVTDAPVGAESALEHFRRMKKPEYVYQASLIPGKASEAALSELVSLATRFPPNVYSDLARTSLARWHVRRAKVALETPSLGIDAKRELARAKARLEHPFPDDFVLALDVKKAKERIAHLSTGL